jgi:hypothetical protein
MGRVMVDHGFDAAYFDAVAHRAKDRDEQLYLHRIADTYRTLAHSQPDAGPRLSLPRAEFWRQRAGYWRERARKCRALADQFNGPVCREQLRKLAATYEFMASAREGKG